MNLTKEQIMQIEMIQIRLFQITGKYAADNRVIEIALNTLEESINKVQEYSFRPTT